MTIDKLGNKLWRNDAGEYHRVDGHAIEFDNGTKEWWINGKLHRESGPAIEWADGDKEWFLNGKLHREDGPAVEFANGGKSWYFNGKRHREDGPAVEFANGDKYWYINGKLHREDGPAVECSNGDKEWFLNGEQLTKDQFNQRKENKMKNEMTTTVEIEVKFRHEGKCLLTLELPQGFIDAVNGDGHIYFSESDGMRAEDYVDPVLEELGFPLDAETDSTPVSGVWIAHWDDRTLSRFDGKTVKLRVTRTFDGDDEWKSDTVEVIK